MKIPVSAIFEGHVISLRGDEHVDPQGRDPAFAQPLRVFAAYNGRPKGTDLHRVRNLIYSFEQKECGEERGMTMIVSPCDGAGATLIYFPDDQREVELVGEFEYPDEDPDE